MLSASRRCRWVRRSGDGSATRRKEGQTSALQCNVVATEVVAEMTIDLGVVDAEVFAAVAVLPGRPRGRCGRARASSGIAASLSAGSGMPKWR